jgi:hypothetical protein
MEPGYTLFPVEAGSGALLVAVDADGVPVWTCDPTSPSARAVSFDPEAGLVSTLVSGAVLRLTLDGEVADVWSEANPIPGSIDLPVAVNHEATFEADGSWWSLHKVGRDVEAYPTSEFDPAVTAPAEIDDDHVMHFAPDGTVLADWSMADRLDPTRIGFGSLSTSDRGALDWGHANAVVPVPGQDIVLVSLRHQDSVVALGLPDGDVRWILANPDGWSPELDALRLQPVGEPFAWPYHQHAPMIAADGRLWLFDNGNERRTTPYSLDPEPELYSRVVAYEIDPAAGTVRQVFSSTATSPPLFSQALGNADGLPVTGNVLATFAYLEGEEDGLLNVEHGLGIRTVRLIELDPAGERVFDLRASVPFDRNKQGVLIDRAIRAPTLYGPGAHERWL